jgi:hypothetical protein
MRAVSLAPSNDTSLPGFEEAVPPVPETDPVPEKEPVPERPPPPEPPAPEAEVPPSEHPVANANAEMTSQSGLEESLPRMPPA